MNTLYAVVCNGEKTRQHLCGLFVSKERADEALAFWNKYAMPGCRYELDYVTTDLTGDQDATHNTERL